MGRPQLFIAEGVGGIGEGGSDRLGTHCDHGQKRDQHACENKCALPTIPAIRYWNLFSVGGRNRVLFRDNKINRNPLKLAMRVANGVDSPSRSVFCCQFVIRDLVKEKNRSVWNWI